MPAPGKTTPRLMLAGLLAAWMFIAWPHLAEQFTNSSRARRAFGALSWEDRAAVLDQPGYRVAQAIARAAPSDECVVVLSYTGPEHLKYYQARFPYYLYPRRVRLYDRTDAPVEACRFLAVFRDTRANLLQEPFLGHWDEAQVAQRTASMDKVWSAEQVEIFRGR